MVNSQTQKKVYEIKNLITEGKNYREILNLKFGRSVKDLNKFLERAKELFSEEELYILMGKEENNSNEVIQVKKEFLPGNEIINHKELQDLKELLHYKDDLINLLKVKEIHEEAQLIHKLEIAEDVTNLKDNKITTIRLSIDLEKKFNEICEKNKSYSKTLIFNQALYEFINKYQ